MGTTQPHYIGNAEPRVERDTLGKLGRPATTVGALDSVGLPASRVLARVLSAAEVVAGSVAAIAGGWIAPSAGSRRVLVAASSAAFAVFLVLALRRGAAVSTCGASVVPTSRRPGRIWP